MEAIRAVKRNYRLAAASFLVLSRDRRLLRVLLGYFAVTVGLGLAFGLAGLVTGVWTDGVLRTTLLLIFLFYIAFTFVSVYLQVALVSYVQGRLSDSPTTLSTALATANARLDYIVRWALVTATFGWLGPYLEWATKHRARYMSNTLTRRLIVTKGAAWSVASFFVVPIMAIEGIGPLAALRRSSFVVEQRWGEAIIGTSGIYLFMWVLGLALALVPALIGVSALVLGGPIGVGTGVLFLVLAVAILVFARVAASALQAVYTAVLYQYATTGDQEHSLFPQDVLQNAFRTMPTSTRSVG